MLTIDECFLLFELTPSCTKDELKMAYKRLASTHHPDRGGNTSLFQHIQYAYSAINKYLTVSQHKKIVNIIAELTLEELFSGKSLFVTVNIDGTEKELLVDVPPGMENGKKINVPNVSVGNDVVITIKEKKHPRIKRNGNDLNTDHCISVFDAMLGCEIQIQNLDSSIEVVIPPGCQNGKRFEYPDCGMISRNGKRGKLTVTIHYNAPSVVSPTSIALLASLQNSLTNQ